MEVKRIRVANDEIPLNMVVILCTFYFVISGLTISGGLQIFCFFMIVFATILLCRPLSMKVSDLVFLLSIIPFFYSVKEWNIAAYRDLFAYLAFVLFIILYKGDIEAFKKPLRLLCGIAFFHLIFVFLNFVFWDKFIQVMYSILDPRAIDTYQRAVKGGYCTGLGCIPGDTSGYLVNGIIVILFGRSIFSNNSKKSTYLISLLLRS